jgi:hypothetical protein
MGIDNVIAGHGLGIAITGMTVVFAGLVLVSIYIRLLPMVTAPGRPSWRQLRRTRRAAGATAVPATRAATPDTDHDLLAAIGYVLQAERERELALDHQLITLREDDEEQRVWTAIGKMRSLATRM